MSFFYDLNKKLDGIRATPEVTHQQLNERDMSRAAKGYEKYGKQGMEALAKAGREGKALDPVRKKYDKYDNDQVDEDFGPGRAGPNKNLPGPEYSFSPDTKNYKTPHSDASVAASQNIDKTMGQGYSAKNYPTADVGAAAMDGRGQTKYVDRTAPGIINKIKNKLGYDMPDPAYGPRPDETQRLAKRYPAPTKESAGPAAAAPAKKASPGFGKDYKPLVPDTEKPAPAKPKSMVDKAVEKAKTPPPYRPSKSAPKGDSMGTIKGGVWTADPPKPGEKGVPVPKNHERVPEAGAPMTAKRKFTFADKIAGAKKEVDEMLGDVAAEAMRSALGGGKGRNAEMDEERSKGTAFDMGTKRVDTPKAGSTERGAKHDIKHSTSDPRYTGRTVTRRTDAQGISVGADDDSDTQAGPRGRGRPKGTKGAIGAKGPSGKSKLMTKEGDQDITDQGEYDQEGDMAKDDIKTIVRHAQALSKVLGDNDNLPEWVQSKLAKIEGMMISIDEYMQNQEDEEEPIAEKAVSKKQQRFMGMVHSAQKGEKPASKAVSKVANTMKPKDTADFAKTKHKGLPEKKKKEVDENSEEGRITTTRTGPGKTLTTSSTGRVSTTIGNGKMSVKPGKSDKQMDDDTDTASVSNKETSPSKSGGMSYGKGIYDSMNRELEQMIAESMSINMSDSTEGNRSLTVTATDEDAMKLAMILKSAGLGSQGGDMHSHGEEACDTCGMPDCGCGDVQEAVDENSPDYPTNTEQADNNFGYSGGLNKPKTDVAGDGQTTIPNTAVHTQDEDALRRMMEMAGLAEAAKPDFLDLDKDNNKDEPMKDAAADVNEEEDTVEESIQRMREAAGIKIKNDLGPTSPDVARMSKDEVNAALRSGMNSKVDLGPTSPDVAAMSSDEVNAALRLGMSPDISDMDPDSVNAEFGKDDRQYEDSMQRMREMAGIKESKKANKDYDGDGKLETGAEEHAGSVDKAIKKAQAEKKVDESIFALTNQWKAYKG